MSLGISDSTIWRYENDRREPGPAVLATLAKALGVRLEWLITGEGPMRERRRSTSSEPPGAAA